MLRRTRSTPSLGGGRRSSVRGPTQAGDGLAPRVSWSVTDRSLPAVGSPPPPFLMNGERGGPTSGAQWRTPPFKACLRQWWRVAYSTMHAHAVVVDEMRNAEQDIFGGTSGDSGKRSSVRIRLDSWTQGSMTQGAWQFGRKIQVGKNSVDALTYAGFGRVTSKAGGIKPNATIQAREHATLRLAFPEKDAPLIDLALALMSRFGNLGGRSRNGWGALHLAFDPVQSGFADLLTEAVCRDWAIFYYIVVF